MRDDGVGFFWDDTPPPKAAKTEKAKRSPPEPLWLADDYLPGLEEAKLFPVQLMTDEEINYARVARQEVLLDVEVYPNYFLAVWTNMVTGKIAFEEMDENIPLNHKRFRYMMEKLTQVTFNGINFDIPICELAAHGVSNQDLKDATDAIIMEERRGQDVRRSYKAKALKIDHIDLIEVAPLFGSLKTYAGRMHARKMQDLPFAPSTKLSPDQKLIVRWYCVNDTDNTALLRETLREQIDLRYTLSNEYKVDLRSKSDAQIAEAVMAAELTRRSGFRPKKPTIEVGTSFRYNVPSFIQYKSPLMNWALETIANAHFVVDHTGSIAMPLEIKELNLAIRGSVYRMGIGGLHSSESTVSHQTDNEYILIDKDVTSFYPFIILNQGLFPEHLGPVFLQVYRNIVNRRLEAKSAGNKPIAESLKIVINGSFGKFGSKYSILYAPNFLIQTTITGQLSILMLIERLEMAGISVVSANTDGIVIKCHRTMVGQLDAITAQWEQDTKYNTEETRYMAMYSRDVNNYIAVKQTEVWNEDGSQGWLEIPDGTKNKGAYSNPWSSDKNLAMRLHKNPTSTICVEAVENYLIAGTPVDHTIRNATDIRKFVSVRTVRGGAVKVFDKIIPAHDSVEQLLEMAGYVKFAEGSWTNAEYDTQGIYAITTEKAYERSKEQLAMPGPTEYIGKTVRWYYAKDMPGEFVYAKTGNKVPRSDGAKPCMVLPDTLPSDIDHDWYITEAVRMLRDIAAIPAETEV